MTQLQLKKAIVLIDNFKEKQEEFNNKYYNENNSVTISYDGDLIVKYDYFEYSDVLILENAIKDYKLIINGEEEDV